MSYTYVMSDIHGNYKAFIDMLEKINLKDEDTLYVLGDVVDRGDRGIDILEYIMSEKNIVLLMGNHEEMMYDALISEGNEITQWFKNGGLPTYKQFKNLDYKTRCIILNYVHNLDKYKIIIINNIKYLLVHAGLIIFPHHSLEELLKIQGDGLLWMRESFLKSKIKTDYKIVFGHTPVTSIPEYINIKEVENNIWINDNKIGIDCGCGYDLKLSCLRLDDMKEYYIELEEHKKEVV